MNMRFGLLLATAIVLLGQTPPDPTEVLTSARDSMIDRTQRAPNYTCVLTVTHKYYRRTSETQRSCDQLIGESKRGNVLGPLEATDRVRLDVKVSNGVEIGSWPGASQFDTRNILDLVRGSFEAGTLGPLLQDIFQNDATEFDFTGERKTGTSTEYEYTFRVPAVESHYHVRTAGGNWYGQIAYDGLIRIDSTSFDMKYLVAKVYDLPPEVQACLMTTTADYQRERIGEGDFLMPRESVLQALRTDSSTSETALEYSGCREYTSESTLRFGGDSAADSSRPEKSAVRPEPLPPGLKFSVAFSKPINTDTAAGGDPIIATVQKAVVDAQSKVVLIPKGAVVHGRIVRLEHFPGSHFVIAVQLEALETPAGEMPIYVKPDSARTDQRNQSEGAQLKQPGTHILLPPIGTSNNAAAFVFRTSGKRYVVAADYLSDWITIAPPHQP